MTLNMFFPERDALEDDGPTIALATEQSLRLAELGFNPWYTDHHFRGPWHSNPLQFAAYIAPQLPADRYMGFGVLSVPLYHPVRLVESMNLLDQLTKGKVLFGLGSGWQGTEPDALGVDPEFHASGRAGEDTLEVMLRLWKFRTGDPEYSFEVGTNRGKVKRRIMPSSYTARHPILIRTASRDSGLIRAAQNGWPAFLGILDTDLIDQANTYRNALAEANHPPEVIEQCQRWCTRDWLSVVVANTDAEAREHVSQAKAEQMALRSRYIAIHGKLDGPVLKRKPEQTVADAYAAGRDMDGTIAGSPETVAAKVQEISSFGINHLLLRFMGEWAGQTRHICETSMRLFSQEIMPRFKNA